MVFLPADFVVPTLVAGPRFQIRPVTVHDVIRVYDAVMGDRDRLASALRGWPKPSMTLQQCLIDVAWQQKEAELRRSFAYLVLTNDGTGLLGAILLWPPERMGADAEIVYWVRQTSGLPGLDVEIADFVAEWTVSAWPFKDVRYPGRSVSWADWAELPPIG